MSSNKEDQKVEKNAQYFIDQLKLFKLPNDMYLAEIYTAPEDIQTNKGVRKASSGVYCLYETGVKVDFHTLEADEVLVLNYGCSLDIIAINPDGSIKKEVLGYDLSKGERPQIVVPRGSLFTVANTQTAPQTFSLVSAFTTPGFDMADQIFPPRSDLIQKYPQHKELIEKFTSQE